LDVAKYIIWYCKENNLSISNLKLQKILYFIQAMFLVKNQEPCFGEYIEAWDFGPVVPEIYHEFKMFGSSEIPLVYSDAENKIVNKDKVMMDSLIDECAQRTASELVEITHNQRPWNDAYEKYCSKIITNESIKEYFEKG